MIDHDSPPELRPGMKVHAERLGYVRLHRAREERLPWPHSQWDTLCDCQPLETFVEEERRAYDGHAGSRSLIASRSARAAAAIEPVPVLASFLSPPGSQPLLPQAVMASMMRSFHCGEDS